MRIVFQNGGMNYGKQVYKYMDWPEIEAVVYAEEASPKDLMAPRLTADGILIQGFFRMQRRQKFL